MKPENQENTMSSGSEYLNARREWNERYGSYVQRANLWKNFAFLCLITLLISAATVGYLVSTTRYIPYLIEIDKLNHIKSEILDGKIDFKDKRVIRAELSSFIENLRIVSSDQVVQKRCIESVYNHLLTSAPSNNYTNIFYRKNNPFERSKTEKVTVSIEAILPLSEESWQIEWNEYLYDIYGKLKNKYTMKAIVKLEFHPPKDENSVITNPLGLFVKELDWTKIK